MVKRMNLWGGHVEDVWRSRCLRKVTTFKRKKVQEVTDQNPKLSLREITNEQMLGCVLQTFKLLWWKLISGSRCHKISCFGG